MSELERFGVAAEAELLAEFDAIIEDRGYGNRSEAIRDMMRAYILKRKAELGDVKMAATITIVYDHHTPGAGQSLTELQHGWGGDIYSTMHVHLDHDNCLEVIVARGKPRKLIALADKLAALRGVKFGRAVLAVVMDDGEK
jgi:CopG family nickel-responsive transcriptional regulator